MYHSKRIILLTVLLLTFSIVAKAQTADQPIGFKIKYGVQGYDGDLGNEMSNYADSDFLYGIGLATYLTSYLDASLELQWMALDFENGPENGEFIKRNTFFETNNLNLNLMGHYKPLDTRLNPYITAGVGFNFLKDLSNTRNDDYHFVFSIPFGIGVNYEILDNVMLNVQGLYNRSFSDDIDNYPLDASQMQNSTSNPNIDGLDHDDFITTSIGIVYNFGGKEKPKDNSNERLYDQSVRNLKAAERASEKSSKTLDQAIKLNDQTLSALEKLKQNNDQADNESQKLKSELIRIVNNIQFEYDSARIIEPAWDELNSLAQIMKTYLNLHLYVEGFADNRGTENYNMKLAQDRAEAVMDYLVNQGIEPSRINTHAKGENPSQMTGKTETSYAQNRSVRITLDYISEETK